MEKHRRSILYQRLLVLLVASTFMAVFLIHFAAILRSSVNIPSDDEWEVYRDPATMSLRWLFHQHNEHRIVTSKVLILLQHHLNGWNHPINQIINFVVYGVILVSLSGIAKKLAPQMPIWTILSFNIFLLSPIAWMNHLIGFQMCFHFWLLCFLLSSYLLFSVPQTWQRLILGCLAFVLCLYSLATGLASGLIVLLLFVIFKITRAYSAKSSQGRIREIVQVTFVVIVLVGAITLWFVDYVTPSGSRGLSLPSEVGFWRMFLNLVSFGFGIDAISITLGAICLLIVIAPVVWQVWRQKAKLAAEQWAAYSMVLAILGTLAFIAMGRSALGIEWSKTSRYSEIGMPLIILSLITWSWVVPLGRRFGLFVPVGLWIFCLVSFSDNWSFVNYAQITAGRNVGRLCVQDYYQHGGPAVCPQLFHSPLAEALERARYLNASFYRDISARIVLEKQQTTSAPSPSPHYSVILDVADCRQLAGWASSDTRESRSLSVEIHDGEKMTATVASDLSRPDVHEAGVGSLLSGFVFPTPTSMKDGQPQTIRVRVAGASRDLISASKSLTCAPP